MFSLNCKGSLLALDTPIVMGIINVTPDSFYSGSRLNTTDDILKQVERMIAEGATIIDVGGQSTRPGSLDIGVSEEKERVIPAIKSINNHFPEIIISVDTFHSTIAREAVETGASIVNDISGGSLDEGMFATVALLRVPYICMHLKGTPETMQQYAQYDNVALEVLDYFIKKIEQCRLAGINDVILDAGFGFAKTIEHNFELLKKLETLKIIDRPILVGVSRKSTIYKTLGVTAEDALNGTTVLNTVALLTGAHILRVHDVKEAVEAIKLVTALNATYESQK
jgi:dihydropteroate synthase